MNRALLAIPALLVLLLAGAVVAPSFIDWNAYKAQAKEHIQSATGYEATFGGGLSLAILPRPRVYAEDITINTPKGPLLSLERVDVNIALLPLLKGAVAVQSVNLVKPEGTVEVYQDGKQNWMTPEIEAMLSKKQPAQAGAKNPLDSISLDHVKIKNGAFQYKNGVQKTVLTDINLDIQATTLKGPFEIEGDVTLNGTPLALSTSIAALEPDTKALTLKTDIETAGTTLHYEGMAGLQDPYDVQGSFQIQTGSLAKTLKQLGNTSPGIPDGPAQLEGTLTASTKAASLKDMNLQIAEQTLTGSSTVSFSPLVVKASLKSQNPVNLDKLLPKNSAASPGMSIDHVVDMVPQTLTLPVDFDGMLDLSMPGFTYNGIRYGQTAAGLQKNAQTFKAAGAVDNLPGNGTAKLDATLRYAHKDGTTYTKPSLNILLNSTLPDTPKTVETYTGQKDLPYVNAIKQTKLNLNAVLNNRKLSLKDTAVILDGTPYKINGTVDAAQDKPVVSASLDTVLSKADLQKFGFDPSVLPESLLGSKLSVRAEGTGDSLKAALNLKNNSGNVGGTTTVQNPFGAPVLGSIAFEANYKSLNAFLQDFAPSVPRYTSFAQPMNFKTDIIPNGKHYAFKNMKGSLAGTSMTGEVTLDLGAAKPSVKGQLTFGNLVLVSGTSGAKSAGGTSKSSGARWSTEKIDTAWLHSANLDLDIKASALTYETWNLSNPALTFALQDGRLNIANMSAGLYGGQAALSGTVQDQSGSLAVKGQTSLSNINLEPLVRSFAGSSILKGKGLINLNANVETAGSSQSALVSALKGQGTTTGQNIILEGIDLIRFAAALSDDLKPGDSLLNLWKGASNGGQTAFDTLDGNFTIANGIVTFDKLDLDGAAAYLKTTGTANFPAWRLKTAHTVTLKNRTNIPPFTINIDGPLDNPAQTFAQGALNDYLSRKLQRKIGKEITKELDGKIGNVLNRALGLPAEKTDVPQIDPAESEQPAEIQNEEGESQDSAHQLPLTPEDAVNTLIKGLF